MDLHLASALDGVGVGDRASTLYQHLLDAIVDGRLRAGAKVPPTRELAAELRVSRGTVTTAYDRLTAEGFLVTRVGSGTFVCPDVVPHRTRHAPVGDVRPRAVWATLPPPVPDAPAERVRPVGGRSGHVALPPRRVAPSRVRHPPPVAAGRVRLRR